MKFSLDAYHFPEESAECSIKISEDKILFKGKDRWLDEDINIPDLQFAYAVRWADVGPVFYLFDYMDHYIPVSSKGFKEVYKELNNIFGFDNEAFFDVVNRNENQKALVWKRGKETNYHILPENRNDYAKGFEILSPEKEFIDWDMPYSEYEKISSVYFDTSPFEQQVIRFKFPVRIGNIVLDNFEAWFYEPPRKDTPVLGFTCDCFDKTNTDRSYFELRETISKMSGGQPGNGYERNDQKHLTFYADGMGFSITYTYTSDWSFDRGSTTLAITNNRKYPALLENQDYENKIRIDDSITFRADTRMQEDYKRNSRIKKRPDKVKKLFKSKTVLWIDRKNNKIGFASGEFAQVFDTSEILSFHIQNIRPAKGAGGSDLYLKLKGHENLYSIFYDEYGYFNSFKDALTKLTGKKVIFEKEFYDV